MTHVVSPSMMLACLSRPQEAALVSVLNDDRPYLTPWRDGTQERRGPGGAVAPAFLPTLPGDCHLWFLRFKCWPFSEPEASHACIR